MTSSVSTYFPQLLGFDCPSVTANGATYYADPCNYHLTPFIPNTIGQYKRVVTGAISSNITVDELHMTPTTPPSLSGTISFMNLNSKIFVPTSAVSAYQSATNWANYADRIVGE